MKTNPFHQTVIVTGGATGIGYAVAAQLQRGNVLLNGRTRETGRAAENRTPIACFRRPDITACHAQISSTPRSAPVAGGWEMDFYDGPRGKCRRAMLAQACQWQ